MLREKIEMDKENRYLKKQCDELKEKLTDLEKKFKEGEFGAKEECMNLINNRMKELKKETDEVHTSFREIMKQQEMERREMAQSEVVRMLKQNEQTVRDIAEKKCVIVTGLKEDTIRNWQERRKTENDRIRTLLNKITKEEDSLFGELEEYVRLGAYEEGKNRHS